MMFSMLEKKSRKKVDIFMVGLSIFGLLNVIAIGVLRHYGL